MSDNGHPISDEELISAMHDGELNETDRARAERLLRDDPELARRLGELRELSARLQSLPRKTLGNDFASEVLRKAEREMLVPSRHHEHIERRDEEPTVVRAGLRLPRGRRPWMWAAAAIAAGVLIMVFGTRIENQRVAQNTKLAFEATPPTAESLPALAPADRMSRGEQADAVYFAKGAAPGSAVEVEAVSLRLAELGYTSPLNEHLGQQALAIDMLNIAAPIAEPMLVVEVEVDRRQLEFDPFTQVLLDNQIHSSTLPQTQRANLMNNLAQTQAGQSAAAAKAAPAVPASAAAADGADLVYVVASPTQLSNTLSQLQQAKQTYRRVVVHDLEKLNVGRAAGIAPQNLALERKGTDADKKDAAALDKTKLADAPVDPSSTQARGAVPAEKLSEDRRKEQGESPAAGVAGAAIDGKLQNGTSLQKAGGGGQPPQNGWFGRLTFPAADTPAMQNQYGFRPRSGESETREELKRKSAAFNPPAAPLAPSGEKQAALPGTKLGVVSTPTVAPQPLAESRSDDESGKKGAVPTAPMTSPQPASSDAQAKDDRELDRQRQLHEQRLNRDQYGVQSGAPNGVEPLQRALFVFRVVDSDAPAGSTAAPSAAPAAAAGPAAGKAAEAGKPAAPAPPATSSPAKPAPPPTPTKEPAKPQP